MHSYLTYVVLKYFLPDKAANSVEVDMNQFLLFGSQSPSSP